MNSVERRSRILEILRDSREPISAGKLAAEFGVTRQVIVSDIALLRANGRPIAAERRGYSMEKAPDGLFKTIICRHTAGEVLDEFYAVVDNGGKVLNVIVEHPIYGQISADLNISSRYDAEEFVEKTSQAHASQLCDLTGGLHIHTLSVPDEASFGRIRNKLSQLGILAEEA